LTSDVDGSNSRLVSRALGVLRVPVPAEVIAVAVRGYLRYGLSHPDVEVLLAERGVEVDHVTCTGGCSGFAPLLATGGLPRRPARRSTACGATRIGRSTPAASGLDGQRDRNGSSVAPQIVRKGQTGLDGFNDRIIA
jgi:hypothetical protein